MVVTVLRDIRQKDIGSGADVVKDNQRVTSLYGGDDVIVDVCGGSVAELGQYELHRREGCIGLLHSDRRASCTGCMRVPVTPHYGTKNCSVVIVPQPEPHEEPKVTSSFEEGGVIPESLGNSFKTSADFLIFNEYQKWVQFVGEPYLVHAEVS